MEKRNYNLDFLRGIATLFIILIHTTFCSGETYLPAWFKNLSLFIDVPVFMFISGMSFNFIKSITKNLKGILGQWKKWIYFLIFYSLILFLFFRDTFNLSEVFHWIAYSFPTTTSLPVVQGSIWFMTMYIKVSILCSIIIMCNENFAKKEKERNLITIICILLLFFLNSTFTKSNLILDVYTSFYSIIYLLGYISYNCKIKKVKHFISFEFIAFIILIIIFTINKISISDIQTIKFPPSFPYLFVAIPSLILCWYLKDYLKINKNNLVNYIGKNAIFFYFSQGISSSLLYFFLPYFKTNIYIKFIALLLINLFLSIIIGVLLNESYNYIFIKKLKEKKNEK